MNDQKQSKYRKNRCFFRCHRKRLLTGDCTIDNSYSYIIINFAFCIVLSIMRQEKNR